MSRRPVWFARAFAVATTLAYAGSVVLAILGAGGPVGEGAVFLMLGLFLIVVGTLVLARAPGNPIGWILCSVALTGGLAGLAEGYVRRYLDGDGGAQGLAEVAAWFANWSWIALVMVPIAFVPAYFPDGHLPSRRWRFVPWCAAVGIATFGFSQAFAAGELADYPQIDNPFGIDSGVVEAAALGGLLVLAAIVGSAASLVVRFRRAPGLERQQIKWLAYAAGVTVVAFVAGALIGGLWSDAVANVLVIGAVVTLPLAVGVAILRYRLYDVDLVINRTLVYGALTATLAGAYVGCVLLLQLVLSPGSDLAIAASTLAVAALFRPARGRIQAAVDRRFYRRKYDAQRTLESFSGRVRDQVELDALSDELRRVVAETMQPAHVSLWMRGR